MTVRGGYECDLCNRREWHDLPKGLPEEWRTEGVCLHICPSCITEHGELMNRIVQALPQGQDLRDHTLSQFVLMVAGQWRGQQEQRAMKQACLDVSGVGTA